MKKKLLLVPIDFSSCSFNALKHAVHIGRQMNARLMLLHAFQIPVTHGELGASLIVNDLSSEITKDLESDFENIKENVPDLAFIEYEYLIKQSYVTDAILSHARKTKADLIVMGTHGASGIQEALIGTNTSSVIQNTDCPILAIPENVPAGDFKSVAFASDYKPLDSNVLQPLIGLANTYNSSVHLLHIATKPVLDDKQMFEALKFGRLFKKFNHDYNFIVNENIEDGINEYIKTHELDLLAVIRRKHDFFEKFFKTSWTKKLSHHIKIPLLILNDITT